MTHTFIAFVPGLANLALQGNTQLLWNVCLDAFRVGPNEISTAKRFNFAG